MPSTPSAVQVPAPGTRTGVSSPVRIIPDGAASAVRTMQPHPPL